MKTQIYFHCPPFNEPIESDFLIYSGTYNLRTEPKPGDRVKIQPKGEI